MKLDRGYNLFKVTNSTIYNSFLVQGPLQWQNLNIDIKNAKSAKSFVSIVKKNLLVSSNYYTILLVTNFD